MTQSIFKRTLLPIALAAAVPFTTASATVFTPYSGVALDGAPLAEALVSDSAITIISGSTDFDGNETGFGASAALFEDLDFGTVDNVDFTLPDGILLSSGNADLPSENTQSGFSGDASGAGDAGLDLLLEAGGFFPAHATSDATVLSFDFSVDPGVNAVALDFIFGSEEYPEFAGVFPEIAGIFIDGTNVAAFANGDLLSVTSDGIASGNFVDNNIFGGDLDDEGPGDPSGLAAVGDVAPLAIEYDGLSIPLTAIGALDTSLTTHSIKIAVSDTNDQVLDTGIFLANMRGLTAGGGVVFDGPGSSPDDPLLPVPGDDPSDGFDFQIFVGDAGIGTDPTERIFFDPDVAIGYEFTSNLAVTSLQVTSDLGDGIYSLDVWDGSIYLSLADFMVNEIVDFTSLAFDVFQWRIGGIETSAMVDPTDPTAFVFGLTFASAGSLKLNQTPITEFVDPNPGGGGGGTVPVPAGIYLLALGALAMRRRPSA